MLHIHTFFEESQGQRQNKDSVVTVIRNGDRVDRENSAYLQDYFSCFQPFADSSYLLAQGQWPVTVT